MGRGQATGMVATGGYWRWLKERLLPDRSRFDCLQVEVSSRCCGRCLYCPRALVGSATGIDMAMATFSRLAPLLACSERVHLQGWGEPFLNPHFLAMATMARAAGCRVSTTTCGLPISASLANEIVDADLDIVAFSLTGTDEVSNRRRRGVSFARVCQGIAALAEAKGRRGTSAPQLHLAYLLFPEDLEALAGLPQLMEELDITATVISTLDYLPEPALAELTFDAAHQAHLEGVGQILAETADAIEKRGRQLHYHFPKVEGEGHGCLENIGRSLFVAADGTVSPCVFTNAPGSPDDPRRRVFGNILEEEPLAIWQGPAYRAFRRDLAAGRSQPPCSTCRKRFEQSR